MKQSGRMAAAPGSAGLLTQEGTEVLSGEERMLSQNGETVVLSEEEKEAVVSQNGETVVLSQGGGADWYTSPKRTVIFNQQEIIVVHGEDIC